MSFSITKQRQETMLERVGKDAAALIDNIAYLPFYRSVQIKLEKAGRADEWGRMIETANTKTNASKYFAKLCKMVRDNTYRFVEKAVEVAKETALFIADKIVRFKFGKYQPFYVRKADAFIKANGMAGFIELIELADRKGLSQKYVAKSLINGKSPSKYYQENVKGAAA